MKRTKLNRRANEILRDKFEEKGRMSCELRLKGCTGTWGLSFCHLHKRRWYYDKDPALLYDWQQVVLGCLNCHQIIEQDPELTRQLFKLLRP
jgi:hypothetical protein